MRFNFSFKKVIFFLETRIGVIELLIVVHFGSPPTFPVSGFLDPLYDHFIDLAISEIFIQFFLFFYQGVKFILYRVLVAVVAE